MSARGSCCSRSCSCPWRCRCCWPRSKPPRRRSPASRCRQWPIGSSSSRPPTSSTSWPGSSPSTPSSRDDWMSRALGWLAVVALGAGLIMGFGVAPREVIQGNVQRIMYLHVPTVLVAYLAFAVVFLASIAYLWRREPDVDRLAHASAEVGVLFTGLTIAAGAIWGKPTWGTWWTWDARLTSVAILFVMYLGYLLLRGMIEDRERGARYAAVLGIIAALDVPLVHFSVYWWRTLHQPPSMLKPGPAAMPEGILTALLVNVVAFTLLYAYFVAKRVMVLRREQEVLE